MKKTLFILLISLSLCHKVFAQTHDVKAKYEKSYNVDLTTTMLNMNNKTLKVNNYKITLSTTLKNIEVVIIKAEDEANEYAKTITNQINNYYLVFYKDGEKIINNDISIEITNIGKILNLYDNQGQKLEVSNNKIKLTGNDYFMTITNALAEIRDNYKIIDINTVAKDIDNIEINDNTNIQIYNNKNELIDNSTTLGTGYKIIINNNNNITEHQIVVKGDTTGDAKINLNDITRLYHYYKVIEPMTDEYVLAGDVATNDIVNLNDITKIYHYHKKFISKL